MRVEELLTGVRYVVETYEPRGTFHVGVFRGFRRDDRLFDAPPDGWLGLADQGSPGELVFERAEIEDWWAFQGWEDKPG